MLAEATVAVLVVPVSWVSQGGLEQTSVTAASTHLIIHCVYNSLLHCGGSTAVLVVVFVYLVQ